MGRLNAVIDTLAQYKGTTAEDAIAQYEPKSFLIVKKKALLLKNITEAERKENYGRLDYEEISPADYKRVEKAVKFLSQNTADVKGTLGLSAGGGMALGVNSKMESTLDSFGDENSTVRGDIKAGNEAAILFQFDSINGLVAEAGTKSEITVTVGGDTWSVSTSLLAEVKATFKFNKEGLEVGVESKMGVKNNAKKVIALGKSEYAIELEGELGAYIEAKASVKAKTSGKVETNAWVGGSVAGSIGLGLVRKPEGLADIKIANGALEVKIEAGVGFKASTPSFELKTEPQAGQIAAATVLEFNWEVTAMTGMGIKLTLRFTQDLSEFEKVFKAFKKWVEEVVIEFIKAKLKELEVKIHELAVKASNKLKRGWDNTKNAARKLDVAVTQLSDKQEAIKKELKRQVGKYEKYKAAVEHVKEKLQNDDLSEEDIESLLSAIGDENQELKDKIKEFDLHNDKKRHAKTLEVAIQRYNQRIVKLTEYTSNTYLSSMEKIHSKLDSIQDLLEEMDLNDISDELNDSDLKKLQKKWNKIKHLIHDLNELKRAKDAIVDESGQNPIPPETVQLIRDQRDELIDHIEEVEEALEDLIEV